MSTDLSVFRREGVDLRVLTIDGEPWFIAADVARTLGYRMASDLTRRLDEDEKGTRSVRTPGGEQIVSIISESGLYAAILNSQVDGARDFKRWVTHDVLPAIRKTGGYVHDVERALPQSYGEALRMLADEVEQRAALAAKVEADAPKVEYVDEFVSHDDVLLLRVAANELGMGEHELRDALVAAHWIYRTLIGTRWSVSRGREMREYEYRASAEHSGKFVSRQQHNAPRHHNGQVRTTLYVRATALPALRRRFAIKAVTA